MNAARRDLADVSLAGQWFAPHYAEPELWVCRLDDAEFRSGPYPMGVFIARLTAGEHVLVLEISGGWAWGYRELDHHVGYIAIESLHPADATVLP